MASVPRMKAEVGVHSKTYVADIVVTMHRPHRLYNGTLAQYLGRPTIIFTSTIHGFPYTQVPPFAGMYTNYSHTGLCAKFAFFIDF